MPSTLPRVRIKVAGREFVLRVTPDTTEADIDRWKRHTRADAERDLIPPKATGRFHDDAKVYLAAVKAMPTYSERARDIGLWIDVFGDRPRVAITSLDIRTARDRWLTSGPRMVQRWTPDPVTRKKVRNWVATSAPLSASTVNHRLRALENLWSVLDGKKAPNPVRDVPEAPEDEGAPRALPRELVPQLLAALRPSVAKAWLAVIAATGLSPMTIARMTVESLNLDEGRMWVPGRRKGKGTAARPVPLTAAGVESWKLFVREGAWRKKPPKGNLKRTWRVACRAVEKAARDLGETIDLSATTPYSLRHSVGTMAYLETGDLKATQGVLGVSAATAARYARAAIDPRLAATVARLDSAQQAATGTPRWTPDDYPDPSRDL